jgi:hypothetical protein
LLPKKSRPIVSKYWIAASEIEKNAAYNYTGHPYYINEPLRGITYSGPEKNSIRDINAMTLRLLGNYNDE